MKCVYEINAKDITELDCLGKGYFGVVLRGRWRSHQNVVINCAIKSLYQTNEELKAEISTMTQLRHQNIVKLYGAVLKESLSMVMELCDGGSLKERLLSKHKLKLLATSLLEYSKQIACGMKYLASKNFVHRDLAARNVLLSGDEKIAKICDFGLARNTSDNTDYYFKQSAAPLPTMWTAPEAIRWKKFSEFSDVWSFGVTMWEIFSYGQNPWEDCECYKVPNLIIKGVRLKKPAFCPEDLYNIMYRCWNIESRQRPTFELIEKILFGYHFKFGTYKQASKVQKIDRFSMLNFCKDDDEIMTKISNTDKPFNGSERELIVIEKRGRNQVLVQDSKTREYEMVSTKLLNIRTIAKFILGKETSKTSPEFKHNYVNDPFTSNLQQDQNSHCFNSNYEVPKSRQCDEQVDHCHNYDEKRCLTASDDTLEMPQKDKNVIIYVKKNWKHFWLKFILASLILLGIVTGLTILNYHWHASKKVDGTNRIAHKPQMSVALITETPIDEDLITDKCSSNLHEGIFIEEKTPLSVVKKLPSDTCSCSTGTTWFWNFTNKFPIVNNGLLFVVHAIPKHCKNFCMCDQEFGCYKPKNYTNYKAWFIHHCDDACQVSATFEDDPYEGFVDEMGNNVNNDYTKVDSIGCNGCDSLKKSRSCNKQNTLDNLRIETNETTAQISWDIASNYSVVDLQVSNIPDNERPIWEKLYAISPAIVDNLKPNTNYTLTVYFYQDRRINKVNKHMWSIAFNQNFQT
uniref:receptor protein-tyrosine kinase n=1 Tax=Acrobeloides nanus TaxID=290746 RepID=A0A914C5Z7_9BILA